MRLTQVRKIAEPKEGWYKRKVPRYLDMCRGGREEGPSRSGAAPMQSADVGIGVGLRHDTGCEGFTGARDGDGGEWACSGGRMRVVSVLERGLHGKGRG